MAPEEIFVKNITDALNSGVNGNTVAKYLSEFDPDGYCEPCSFSLHDYREPTFSKKCNGLIAWNPGEILNPDGESIGNIAVDALVFFPFKDSKSSRNSIRAMRYRAALMKFFEKNRRDIGVSDLDTQEIETQPARVGSSHYLMTGVNIISRINFTRIY